MRLPCGKVYEGVERTINKLVEMHKRKCECCNNHKQTEDNTMKRYSHFQPGQDRKTQRFHSDSIDEVEKYMNRPRISQS
jgi:hypothetical protein